MKSVGLTTYSFCVRDNDNNQYELHNINGNTFIQIINNLAYVNLNEYDNDTEKEAVFSYDQIESEVVQNENGQDEYDALLIRVKTGEYGVESELIDSMTGELTYTRGPEEADVMPFGCCIMVPSGQVTSGVFVFQSIGRYGIVTIIRKYVEEYLKRFNNNLRVVFEPIMPRLCATKLFEEGILKTVRMIRYEIPDDDADRYGIDRNTNEIVEERVLRKPAGFWRNKATEIREFLNREREIEDIIQIEGFEIDDLKFEFKNGKRIKTISLMNLDKLVMSEDITEEIILENGHPTFTSLCASMKRAGEYYLRAKGLLI